MKPNDPVHAPVHANVAAIEHQARLMRARAARDGAHRLMQWLRGTTRG